jgi:hypothetical protein
MKLEAPWAIKLSHWLLYGYGQGISFAHHAPFKFVITKKSIVAKIKVLINFIVNPPFYV